MTLEQLQKKLSGINEKIAKAETRIEAIQALLLKRETELANSKKEDNESLEFKIYSTKREIERKQSSLNWLYKNKAEVEGEIAKLVAIANSRNIKAINDFLKLYADNVREWYMKAYEFIKDNYNRIEAEIEEELRPLREAHKNAEAHYLEIELRNTKYHGYWEGIRYVTANNTFDSENFEKYIRRDCARKYDTIVKKAEVYIGKIADATNLYVADNGQLNGIVIGESGKKARVETIIAGGYNIQCMHFRVLVKKLKD